MKFTIKIIDPDIIDCSSCYNYIYPNPKSRELLLEMILRIYESDVVSRIGWFKFWLDGIELISPDVIGEGGIKDENKNLFEFQTGQKAENDKLAGLFVKKKDKTLRNYIEPGLSGIRNAIFFIRALYNDERDDFLQPYTFHHLI